MVMAVCMYLYKSCRQNISCKIKLILISIPNYSNCVHTRISMFILLLYILLMLDVFVCVLVHTKVLVPSRNIERQTDIIPDRHSLLVFDRDAHRLFLSFAN